MRKMQLGGLLTFATLLFMTTACEKDPVQRTLENVVSTPGDTTVAESPKVLVVNTTSATGLDVNINGNKVADDLGAGDLTQYVDLNDGNATIDLITADGKVVASSKFYFNKQEFYNLVISLDDKGLAPKITILGVDPMMYANDGALTDLLGSSAAPADLFGVNFADLTGGIPTGSNIVVADYLNELNKVVPAITPLNPDELSKVLFGNNDILKDMDVLNTDLDYNKLVEQLGQQNGLELVDLSGVLGLLGAGSFDGTFNLLNSAVTVLGDLMGGNTGSLVTFYDSLLKEVTMVPGHDYTGILFGDKNNPQLMLIDQTLAGLPKAP